MATKSRNTVDIEIETIDKFSAPLGRMEKAFADAQKGITTTQKEIAALNGSLGNVASLEKATKKLEELTKAREADAAASARLTAKIKEQESELGRLRAEYEATGKTNERLKSKIDQTSEKLDKSKAAQVRLSRSIEQTESKMGLQRRTIDISVRSLAEAGVSVEKLTDEQKRLKESVESATEKMKAQKETLSGLGALRTRQEERRAAADRMLNRGADMRHIADMAFGGARKIAGFAREPIRAAQDIETELAGLGSTVGAFMSKEERQSLVAPLRAQAEKLAVAQGLSAAEIIKSQDALVKAGLKVSIDAAKNEVAQALPVALDFAKAGDLQDLGAAAKALVQGKTIFGSDFRKTSDALVTGANASLLDVGDFAVAFRYSAQAAKGLGMTIEQTSSWLSLLGQAGFTGETAGTGFRGVLSAFMRRENRKTFGDLGVRLMDKQGKFRGVDKVLIDFDEALRRRGLGEFDRQSVYAAAFGEQAMGPALSMAENARNASFGAVGKRAGIGSMALASLRKTLAPGTLRLSENEAVTGATEEEMLGRFTALYSRMGEKAQRDLLMRVFRTDADSAEKLIGERQKTQNYASYLYQIEAGGGASAAIAGAKRDTSRVRLMGLEQAKTNLQARAGETLIPTLDTLVGKATGMTSDMGDWIKNNPQAAQALGMTTMAASALLGGAGAATSALGTMQGVIGGLGGAASSATAALGGVSSALAGLAGPVGLGIAGAAVVGGLGYWAYQSDKAFKEEKLADKYVPDWLSSKKPGFAASLPVAQNMSSAQPTGVSLQMPVNITVNGNADPKELQSIFESSAAKVASNLSSQLSGSANGSPLRSSARFYDAPQ